MELESNKTKLYKISHGDMQDMQQQIVDGSFVSRNDELFKSMGGSELFGTDGAASSNAFQETSSAAIDAAQNNDKKKPKTAAALESLVNTTFDTQWAEMDGLDTDAQNALDESKSLLDECRDDEDKKGDAGLKRWFASLTARRVYLELVFQDFPPDLKEFDMSKLEAAMQSFNETSMPAKTRSCRTNFACSCAQVHAHRFKRALAGSD